MEQYDSNDFESLLEDLCSDGTTSEDLSSADRSDSPNSLVVKIYQQGNKKTKVFESREGVVQFEASFPKPRVIHSDIRRSYADMFVHTMNSGDFPLVYGFLDTFLAPDCLKVATKRYRDPHLYSSSISEQKGIVDISKHWYCRMNMAPDTCVSLKNVRIVSNSKTDDIKIVANFEMKATKIYEEVLHQGFCCSHKNLMGKCPNEMHCTMKHFANKKKSKYYKLPPPPPTVEVGKVVGKKRSQLSVEDTQKETMREIMSSVEDLVSNLAVREVPQTLQAEGDFIMFINEDKRISRMEMSIVV